MLTACESTWCVKSSRPALTHYNFDKGGPIFIIFALLNSVKEVQIKLSPPLKSVAAELDVAGDLWAEDFHSDSTFPDDCEPYYDLER